MKVLILGATGLIGHSLWRDWKERGWDVTGTYLQHPFSGLARVDALESEQVEKLLEQVRPQAMVVTAANPFVDYCEMHSVETRKINVDATLKIAEIAKRARVKLVFFSSDYVFDGEKGRPYVEQDQPRPQNEYGRQKVMAEAGIQRVLANHLILRVSGVFGWELRPKNLVLQVLEKCKTSSMRVADDLSYNPTFAPDLGPAIAELLERDAKGVYHLVGAETMSRFDFVRRILETFELPTDRVQRAKNSDLSPVRRPRCSALDTNKLMTLVQTPPWAASRALEKMRDTSGEWETYAKSLPVS